MKILIKTITQIVKEGKQRKTFMMRRENNNGSKLPTTVLMAWNEGVLLSKRS